MVCSRLSNGWRAAILLADWISGEGWEALRLCVYVCVRAFVYSSFPQPIKVLRYHRNNDVVSESGGEAYFFARLFKLISVSVGVGRL